MATANHFIGSAIELNMAIQEDLFCTIHQDLLQDPISLPCFHRFCVSCFESYITSNRHYHTRFPCPNCNTQHALDSNWRTGWSDKTLKSVIANLRSNQTDLHQKIRNFVENSFSQFEIPTQRISIKSISMIYNPNLKKNFENCKNRLGFSNVVTLLHGTDADSGKSIGKEGFRLPNTFDRSESVSEGELKFGKAIYLAHAKKATEYGDGTLILTDCLLGKVQKKSVSHLKLTPNDVHREGFDTIYYYNEDEGLVNQEWAVYRVDQCLPLCLIQYSIQDRNALDEIALQTTIAGMNYYRPDFIALTQALAGTDNQIKAALIWLADSCFQASSEAVRLLSSLLSILQQNQIESLFYHQNETIRILFLRLLWHVGRMDHTIQFTFHRTLNFNALVHMLKSGYTDIAWRVCGIFANMAFCVIDVRKILIQTSLLQVIFELLKRGMEGNDTTCVITILNLLANIACTEYRMMKNASFIGDYINENILDHPLEDIRDAGNRYFCNIIGQGTLTRDWIRAGYQETAMAPDLKNR